MADETVTLEFLARQLDRVLSEQRTYRADIKALTDRVNDLVDGQVVLTQMMFGIERSMVRVKELLGHMDGRITKLEGQSS